jgi:tryptophan synthase alpha chain
MGYLNPVEIMGADVFVEKSLEVGVDGVLLVDMPPAEAATINRKLTEAEIDAIFLIAPTTSADRVKSIVELTRGYVYYVSLKGVTGASISDAYSVQRNVDALRKMTDLPVVVGFGVKDEQSAESMSRVSDGVIVGTALVKNIESLADVMEVNQQDIARCTSIIKRIREQLDSDSNNAYKES